MHAACMRSLEGSEVVFFSCIFVGIAAVAAFIPSTLQLDILNGFQLLNIAVSGSLCLM